MTDDKGGLPEAPDKATIAGVKSILSQAFGPRPRRLSFCRLSNAGSSADFKTFWKVTVEGRRPQVLFVKQSDKKLRSSAIHEYLSSRDLPVPTYLGQTGVENSFLYAWRYVEGHAAGNFSGYSIEDVERVARALATIVVKTQDAAQHVVLPQGMAWIGPKAEDLSALEFLRQKRRWIRALRIYSRREAAVLERLNSLEANVLTHNDVKAPNVILAEDSLAIVDWDSASLGPHGASLRVFARSRHSLDALAASAYVDTLREHGVQVDLDSVLFVLRAQEVFWGLSTGLKHQNPGRILKGLRLAQTAFADFD